MNHETLKVGDVLKVTESKIYHIVIISIVHFQQYVYFNCMFFSDYAGLDTGRYLMTFTPADFDRHVITKIDV